MEKVVSDTTPHPRVGNVQGKCVATRIQIRVLQHGVRSAVVQEHKGNVGVYWSIHRSAIH